MAERRMFAKTIVDSDAFLDMPQTTQLLYFHLAMRADDDGFINNPKSIMRNVKCSEDDLKLLAAKKFLIPFESGVVVIKHWKIHNYIRNDRYKPTKYKGELSMLNLDENSAYTFGIPCDNQMDTQDRLGKDRLGEDSIELIEAPKEEIKNSFKKMINDYTKNPDLKTAIIEFIKMRKGMKRPFTERAITLMFGKLDTYSNGNDSIKIEILNQSILNGWQGVFELKSNKSKPQGQKSNMQRTYENINWNELNG